MIIKSRDVPFVEDMMSIGNDLEIHPSEKNEAPIVVGVDECSKSPLIDLCGDIEEHEEQVRDNQVAI